MVYFHAKNPTLGNFGGLGMKKMLVFYFHLEYFTVIWYFYGRLEYLRRFGIFFSFWYAVPRRIWQP
jgi:hypothetical protein